MLKLRVLSGSVLLAGLLGLLYVDGRYADSLPGIFLLPAALLMSHLMVRELGDLWQDCPDRPHTVTLSLGTAVPLLLATVPRWSAALAAHDAPALPGGSATWAAAGVLIAIMFAFVAEMWRFDQPGRATGRLARTTLGIVYCGWFVSFLVSLRLWRDAGWGLVALVSVILIVKSADTGAYFVGRAAGRRRLAPVISPHKTWEGLAGGVAAAWLAGGCCYGWLAPRLASAPDGVGPLGGWLLYATLLAVAGLLGDLAESLLKRDANRKDSSSWLPGLGGVLDLADSLTFAAPAAYLCWTAGLIGPP